MNIIENCRFDGERALYNLKDTLVRGCVFAGPADGESALKEARNVSLEDCSFSLRYPLWHVQGFWMKDTSMDELTRAAIWYASNGVIIGSTLGGSKQFGNAVTSTWRAAMLLPRNLAGKTKISP